MGGSASKTARSTAGAARKYPTRAPGAAVPPVTARAKPTPAPRTDGAKDEAIRTDRMDPDFSSPDFSQRLHQMGIVDPNPTFSHSSTATSHLSPESMEKPLGPLFPSAKHNSTLSVLAARSQLQERANEDFEAMGRRDGRRLFVDMRTLLDALELRNRGMSTTDVESRLRLEPGLLKKLGPQKLFTHLG